ncbi:MAG TPA: hypothetical protein VJM50_24660, partial [Pyrinomonadaceae bacterium]|nr:hypothetical protein [Pyrinomonadaceae bacterium]
RLTFSSEWHFHQVYTQVTQTIATGNAFPIRFFIHFQIPQTVSLFHLTMGCASGHIGELHNARQADSPTAVSIAQQVENL